MRARLNGICEVCKENIDNIQHKHHLVPRTDPRSTNLAANLAYICPNCHAKTHKGLIIMEGVFMTTQGFKLFWHYKDEDFIIRPGIFLLKDGTADIIEAE